jgi:hypothetical protein
MAHLVAILTAEAAMKKLAVLSIVCLLAPAFSAGAVETIQRKHASKANEQKTNVTRPALRLSIPADSYRA